MLSKNSERGQGLVEYALILIFVFFVVIVVLVLLGPAVGNLYSQIIDVWPPFS